MLVRAKSQRLSVAQYLELENCSDVRHEYLAGEIYAIATAASLKHQIIASNLYVHLQLKL